MLVALGLSISAEAREFRVADTHPDDYPTVQALRQMGRLLSESTHGEHTLTRPIHDRFITDAKLKDLVRRINLVQ